jgi:dUTP pyrophosphatase
MILKIFVNPDNNELRSLYENQAQKHNNEIQNTAFPNSGFDLFTPNNVLFSSSINSKFVDLDIKCEMVDNNGVSSAFYLYPRSSISKTPLMLANHTGIIDSGYRGNMIAAFRCLGDEYLVEKHTRLVQICTPTLSPFLVIIVNNENALSSTERGSGGFGSTGR